MVSRAAVGWALLFAVPPGIGVTGYATMVIGEGTLEPLALATGAGTAAIIFAVVLGSQLGGSAEPKAVRERID